MKARELAREYRENAEKLKNGDATAKDLVSLLSEIIGRLIEEIHTLGVTRRVHSDSGVASIINEQNDKFRSFAIQVGVDRELFDKTLKDVMPETHKAWMKQREIAARALKDRRG